MSAYVVDDSTINKVVAGLRAAFGNGDRYPHPTGNLAIVSYAEAVSLANDCRALNVAGVMACYGEEDATNLPGPCGEDGKLAPFTFNTVTPPTPTSFYKAIRCLLYQCDEGNTSDLLFMALDKYARDLAEWIVQHSEAYDLAEWG